MTTESTVVFSAKSDSAAAGTDIGEKILAGLSAHSPHALIVFASSRHDYSALLEKCAHAGAAHRRHP